MGELARAQIAAADLVVLNKVDLVNRQGLEEVKHRVHELAPGSRILETTFGRVPSELVFGSDLRSSDSNAERESFGQVEHSHRVTFDTWHWTCKRPLSLPKLQAALDALPEAIYRAKGMVYLEELPDYRVVLQMVGKRHQLGDRGRWEAARPQSEIVMIGTREGIDVEGLQQAFDACAGTGDETQSPVLRLARKLGLSQPTIQDCKTRLSSNSRQFNAFRPKAAANDWRDSWKH